MDLSVTGSNDVRIMFSTALSGKDNLKTGIPHFIRTLS
jgi:hypothetical protein